MGRINSALCDRRRKEWGHTMDARELLVMVDGIARKKGLNQSQWSRASGHAANGQTVSRIMHKGDCRVSTFLALLDAIGCEIEIKGSDL